MPSLPQLLVDVRWLRHQRLADLTFVDVRNAEAYAAGHLPGAVHWDVIPLHFTDSTAEGIDRLRDAHVDSLEQRGIARSDLLVFYHEKSGALAGRALWAAHLLGHPQAAILDGGLAAWREAGMPMTQEVPQRAKTVYVTDWNRAILADAQQTLAAIGARGTQILDTRSDDEWSGRNSRGVKRGGTIPGAKHLEYVHNLDSDGNFKPPQELAAQYRALGLEPADEIITFCEAGGRAAHSYVALKLAGFTNVRNYSASWREWGGRDDLPVEIPSA